MRYAVTHLLLSLAILGIPTWTAWKIGTVREDRKHERQAARRAELFGTVDASNVRIIR